MLIPAASLLFGVTFAPAPLALMSLVYGVSAMSKPVVIPLVPHAKRFWFALLLPSVVILTPSRDRVTPLLSAAVLAACIWVCIWVRTRRGRASCYSTGAGGSDDACACIFLHGLGARATEMQAIGELVAPEEPRMRWLFPSAPVISMTVDMGLPRSSWFDIVAADDAGEAHHVLDADLADGITRVHGQVDALQRIGIPASRVFLAGFSQGGALALAAALASPTPLAGVVVLSGFLPNQQPQLACEANRTMPILWCHGAEDPHVSISQMRRGVARLRDGLGLTHVTAREHGHLGHDIAPPPSASAPKAAGGMAASSPLEDFRAWLAIQVVQVSG